MSKGRDAVEEERFAQLIASVERAYGILVTDRAVIKPGGRGSLVARLVADNGRAYAVKCLYEEPERQRFIAESERLLAERGVPLARPVPAEDGGLCLMHDGAPHVLYEWVDGPAAPLMEEEHLMDIVLLAARLHAGSRDLAYPKDVRRYAHLDWREEYRQRIRSMESWLEKHGGASGKKAEIAAAVPFFVKEGERALEELENSRYGDYRAGGLDPPTLVHGDLHHNNVLCSAEGKTLIDFEDVRYDAPSKDLLRILSMYTKRKPFDGETLLRILRLYRRTHPLSRELRRIIRIDLWFPHIFERMLRKKVYKRLDERGVRFIVEQERRKAEFVRERYFRRAGTAVRKGGTA